MREKQLPFRLRVIFYAIGLLILTLGVSLILKCELGAGAWDALAAAQSRISGWKIGYWIWINGIILLFVNAWLLKTRPQYGAVFTFILIGVLVNGWMYSILPSFSPSSYVAQWIYLVVGIICIGIGVSFYLQVHFPSNPIDHLMIAIHKRFGISLAVAKLIGEVFAFILALILAGPIGIGTVIVTLCIGPVVQSIFPYAQRIVMRFAK